MGYEAPQAITCADLGVRLTRGEQPQMIDVRELHEWNAGHIAGSVHIPLGELTARQHQLKPDQELIIICRSGNRSGQACDYLAQYGFRTVNLTGGLLAWNGPLQFG